MGYDFLGNEFLSIYDRRINELEMKRVSGDNCYIHYRLNDPLYCTSTAGCQQGSLSEGIVEHLDFARPGQAICAKLAETVGKGLLPLMPYHRVY